MDIIVLAGGFGGRFDERRNTAKPLIRIGGTPIIDRIMRKIEEVPNVENTYVVTNNKFVQEFITWHKSLNTRVQVTILNDGVDLWNQRMGAVGAVQFSLDKSRINSDILVIGGDNLFDFELRSFASFVTEHGIAVPVYDLRDSKSAVKYTVVELGFDNRIVHAEEKPLHPATNLVTPCIYGFTSAKLQLIKMYLDQGCDPDSLGKFVEWVLEREPLYGFPIKGKWVDVGDKESYKLAMKLFSKNIV